MVTEETETEEETAGTCTRCGDPLALHEEAEAMSAEEIQRAIRAAEREHQLAHVLGQRERAREYLRATIRLRCVEATR